MEVVAENLGPHFGGGSRNNCMCHTEHVAAAPVFLDGLGHGAFSKAAGASQALSHPGFLLSFSRVSGNFPIA